QVLSGLYTLSISCLKFFRCYNMWYVTHAIRNERGAEHMSISENARDVLERRYPTRDDAGRPTEPADGRFRRVADAIAAADGILDPGADTTATAERFYRLMSELDFLPNSPTLMNAGRPLGQLSACFVLPVGDSMEEIFDAIKY